MAFLPSSFSDHFSIRAILIYCSKTVHLDHETNRRSNERSRKLTQMRNRCESTISWTKKLLNDCAWIWANRAPNSEKNATLEVHFHHANSQAVPIANAPLVRLRWMIYRSKSYLFPRPTSYLQLLPIEWELTGPHQLILLKSPKYLCRHFHTRRNFKEIVLFCFSVDSFYDKIIYGEFALVGWKM